LGSVRNRGTLRNYFATYDVLIIEAHLNCSQTTENPAHFRISLLLSAPLYNLSDLDDNDLYLRAPQPADGIDKGGQGH